MPHATINRRGLAERGRAYYEEHLRADLEPKHKGEFLALEVDSGDYELDRDELAAIQRARARHPESIFYVLRVGYRAAHRIGGGSLRRSP